MSTLKGRMCCEGVSQEEPSPGEGAVEGEEGEAGGAGRGQEPGR